MTWLATRSVNAVLGIFFYKNLRKALLCKKFKPRTKTLAIYSRLEARCAGQSSRTPAHRAHAPAVVKSEKENRKKTKEIPCKDPTRRREYDKAYKQKQRATGLTKKGIDTRLTAIEIETAEDVRDLSHEVVAEVRNADSSSFELEPKLRIKL